MGLANPTTRSGAAALARAIRAGEVSSVDVVREHIARVEEVNPALNAAVSRLYDEAIADAAEADGRQARGETLGPLHGVPITIKDQFLVLGTPTTWGLTHRREHRAQREGTLVTRLRKAGAIPFAKTNVPQLLMAHETDNELYGRTNNPWNTERTPGGSSGGEAALVAAHASPLGLGGDLGGSIRIPCHFTGIHGLKPTAGRLPGDDNPSDILPAPEAIVPQVGPMARHVDDLVLAMRVLVGDPVAGPALPPVPWADPASVSLERLRVAVQADDGFFTPSPALRRAVEEAGAALANAGATLVDWNPRIGEQAFDHFLGLVGADGFTTLRDALAGEKPHALIARLLGSGRVPPMLAQRLAAPLGALGQTRLARLLTHAGKVPTAKYLRRLGHRYAFREIYAAQLRAHRIDAIVCPPYGLVAPPHGRSVDTTDAASYAFAYSVLGLPAGVCAATRVRADERSNRPASRDAVERAAKAVENESEGMPVGVQVVAPWWREDVVLRVMGALEEHFRAQPDYPTLP